MMETIPNLISHTAAFTVLATLMYSCCIADPKNSKLSRFFNRTIPTYIMRNLGRGSLQVVYLIVVLGSWSVIFLYGYPAIDKSSHVDDVHKISGYVVFAMCIASWLYASNTSPGNVTATTIPLFDHYEYDNVLYTRRECPTLKIRKIARSKYDRYTKRHVPRFDHFCGWVGQAVGEQNYRWFLLFLIVHVLMCVYGSWAMGTLLYGEVIDNDLLNTRFHNDVLCSFFQCGDDGDKASYIIIFHHLLMRHVQIVGVLLLMIFIVICLGIFLGFHLYITSLNMTTNEYYKWSKLRKIHEKKPLRYIQALTDGTIQISQKDNNTKPLMSDDSIIDADVGCTGPIGDTEPSGVERDREIHDPGPMPKNIYDKGIIANFMEILKPFSLREKAIHRYKTSMQENGSQNLDNSDQLKCKST